MIRSISATNSRGEKLTINVAQANAVDGLQLVNIDGLGGPGATVNMVGLASVDGSKFNSAKANGRHLSVTILMQETPTSDSWAGRSLIYKHFPVKEKIIFGVTTDTRVVYTEAYVETNVVAMFSKNENAVISLLCESPYFTGVTPVILPLSGYSDAFEFPFWNNTNEPQLVFGNIGTASGANFVYTGDTTTGTTMILTAGLAVSGMLSVYNSTHSQKLQVDIDKVVALVGSVIQYGDRLLIDTRSGLKSVYHIRGNVITNALGALVQGSYWLTIKPGTNHLSYELTSGREGSTMLLIVPYLYEGV